MSAPIAHDPFSLESSTPQTEEEPSVSSFSSSASASASAGARRPGCRDASGSGGLHLRLSASSPPPSYESRTAPTLSPNAAVPPPPPSTSTTSRSADDDRRRHARASSPPSSRPLALTVGAFTGDEGVPYGRRQRRAGREWLDRYDFGRGDDAGYFSGHSFQCGSCRRGRRWFHHHPIIFLGLVALTHVAYFGHYSLRRYGRWIGMSTSVRAGGPATRPAFVAEWEEDFAMIAKRSISHGVGGGRSRSRINYSLNRHPQSQWHKGEGGDGDGIDEAFACRPGTGRAALPTDGDFLLQEVGATLTRSAGSVADVLSNLPSSGDGDGEDGTSVLLEFDARLSTRLKIAVVGGDDMSMSFAHFLMTACGSGTASGTEAPATWRTIHRKNDLEIADTVRGGGAVAYWRVDRPTMEAAGTGQGEGRRKEDAAKILEHLIDNVLPSSSPNGTDEKIDVGVGGDERGGGKEGKGRLETTIVIENFDAVIVHLTGGDAVVAPRWRKKAAVSSSLSSSSLTEIVQWVRDSLRASTVVLTTIPMTSASHSSREEWALHRQRNSVISKFARDYDGGDVPGVRCVLILDLERLTSRLVEANAALLGYSVSPSLPSPDAADAQIPAYIRDQLAPRRRNRSSGGDAIARVCSVRVEPGSSDCVRNSLVAGDGGRGGGSSSGWCLPAVGPRYVAATSCLLGCALNDDDVGADGGDSRRRRWLPEGEGATSDEDEGEEDEVDEGTTASESARRCEDSCNRRFMDLTPIPSEFVDGGILTSSAY